jgi:hypothetical protein
MRFEAQEEVPSLFHLLWGLSYIVYYFHCFASNFHHFIICMMRREASALFKRSSFLFLSFVF